MGSKTEIKKFIVNDLKKSTFNLSWFQVFTLVFLIYIFCLQFVNIYYSHKNQKELSRLLLHIEHYNPLFIKRR